MTNTPGHYNGDTPNRLDRIEATLERLSDRQTNTQQQLDDFIQTANTVLARSAILDDVLLELRDSHEQHQRNFEEHQRTTNAALQSLEAILLQLIRRNN